MMRMAVVVVALCAACGSDNSSNKQTDAPKQQSDAPGASVVTVSCTGGIAPVATVTTSDTSFMFSPNAVTIMQGQVVEFMMSGSHNVVPNSTGSDPGLMVDFGQTKCLQFTKTGTFGFHCMPHGFTGTITVN